MGAPVLLGTQLERELERVGWTRKQFAVELGVSRQILHRWMTGVEAWPAERATQAAALLGVGVDVLFEREG
jgi:transcriptional regulator with XRE-family HTH domain